MTTHDDLLRQLAAAGENPEYLRDLAYEQVDGRHGTGPASGTDLVDLALHRALVAFDFHDPHAAREHVARAFRAPPDEGAPEPFVLCRALRFLGGELFRAIDVEGPGGDWFDVLRRGLSRPGDDVTVVVLSALDAADRVHGLPRPLADAFAELVERYAGTDPRSPAERVLAGTSHEPDLVFDVLELTAELRASTDEAQHRSEAEAEGAARADA